MPYYGYSRVIGQSRKVKGGKELARVFEELQLDKKKRRKVARIFRKAGKVVQRRAQEIAPRGKTGNLRKEIRVSVSTRRGVRARIISSAPHSHLVEYGTKPRYRKRAFWGGRYLRKREQRYTGVMPANPYMRPAFDQVADQVMRQIERDIWDMVKAS